MSFSFSALLDLVGRLHPLVVHFPIALLLVAGLAELPRLQAMEPSPGGLFCLRPGAAMAFVSAGSGWFFADPQDLDPTLWWHRWLGISVAIVAIVALISSMKLKSHGTSALRTYRLSLLICLPLVGITGHLGGELNWGEGFLKNALFKVFASETPTEPSGDSDTTPTDPDDEAAQLFEDVVRPTLDKFCIGCHGEKKSKGKLRLDLKESAFSEHDEEFRIVPGDPGSSLLVELLQLPADDEDRMPPPEEPQPTPEQIAGIIRWISEGAPWPEDGARGDPGPQDPETELSREQEHFLTEVRPILEGRCFECHGPDKQKSKLRFDDREVVFAEREEPVVVPGKPESSGLIARVRLGEDHDDRMPPKGPTLGGAEIKTLESWIKNGAHWAEAPSPAPSEERPKRSLPRARTAGQIPDFKAISINNQEREAVMDAVEKLAAIGVRAAPISRADDAFEVNFRLRNKTIEDPALALLEGLEPALTSIDLSRTRVSAGGIGTLSKFRHLRRLNLSETAADDSAVAALGSLEELTVLNLFGSQVTDACMATLEKMVALKRVYLWRTSVSRSAAEALARTRRDLLVDVGVAPDPVPLSTAVKIETSGVWPGRADLAEAHIHDGAIDTIWAGPEDARSGWIQLTLVDGPQRVVGVRLDEGSFPRIQKFSIETLKDSDWVELARGTTIGSMKTLLFEGLNAQVFRLQIQEATETPVIAEFDLLTD